MDYCQIKAKVAAMMADTQQLLAQPELEPCYRAGLESVAAHLRLLCIELALDVE